MNCPKVTIAILSWNRLHYLRATMESAHECIKYPDIEWIVSDNESEEPGLRDYIQGLAWVQHKLFKKQTHAAAMNQIVETASGEFLIIWPEDVQFIVAGDWLVDFVEILQRNKDIGSMSLDALRRATIQQFLAPHVFGNMRKFFTELYWYRTRFRRSRTVTSSRGVRVVTLGWIFPGVAGSGIPSLTRTDVWRALGPWRTRLGSSSSITDSSLGAEEDMYARFHLSRLPLQTAIPFIPVAADIITDPTGCKAKVRDGKRYGVYMPAPSADGLYYDIVESNEVANTTNLPLSFKDLVRPKGFRIPVDPQGDRLKSAINLSVVFDIASNVSVPYPLIDDASL